MTHRGVFFAFEGLSGSGKSRAIRAATTALKQRNYQVTLTKEPGEGMQEVRELVLVDRDPPLGPRAQLLAFATDRAEHVEKVIAPALADGKVVLCENFEGAMFANQGYGDGFNLTALTFINEIAVNGVHPDHTLYFDVEPQTGYARKESGRSNRIDRQEWDYHERVREGFHQQAARENWFFIDATPSLEEVVQKAVSLCVRLVQEHYGGR